MHNTLSDTKSLEETIATLVDNTFKLLIAMKTIFCAPHVQPNGPALSCGADNIQHAPNEVSSC